MPRGNIKNLKPFQNRTPEEVRLLGSIGGKARTQAKKNASKYREIKRRLKEGTLKSDDPKWLLERVENDKAFAIDIISYLDEIKKTVHPNQRIALSNTYKDMLKTVHGDKIRISSENVNMNVNVDINTYLEKLYNKRNGEENE